MSITPNGQPRGRPRTDRKSHVSAFRIAVTLRLQDAEHVRKLAAREGLPVSMWVRRILLRTLKGDAV